MTAYENLTNLIAEAGKITPDAAQKVADLYIKEKIAHIDIFGGNLTFPGGGEFLDEDVILRAVNMTIEF